MFVTCLSRVSNISMIHLIAGFTVFKLVLLSKTNINSKYWNFKMEKIVQLASHQWGEVLSRELFGHFPRGLKRLCFLGRMYYSPEFDSQYCRLRNWFHQQMESTFISGVDHRNQAHKTSVWQWMPVYRCKTCICVAGKFFPSLGRPMWKIEI